MPQNQSPLVPNVTGRKAARICDAGEELSTATPSGHQFEAQVAVGNLVRLAREGMRLTQAEVAEATRKGTWQLSRAAVSAIERGQNFPGLEAMLALSNVLYLDPKEIIERARLAAVLPGDESELSDEELEARASEYFWAGSHKNALAIYDTLLERLAVRGSNLDESPRVRQAVLEIRRATALKRAGALHSALSAAERAIALAIDHPTIQAEAYIVLAGLQSQRGHEPLARDAADRAVALAASGGPTLLARATIVRGQVLHLAGDVAAAKAAFLEAREHAIAGDDLDHLTHIDGNIGVCSFELGGYAEARSWLDRAIQEARDRRQPSLEAGWLVTLGRVAFVENKLDEADRLARQALAIACNPVQIMTTFRAEWLRHRVDVRSGVKQPDAARIQRMRKLFIELKHHAGVDEIREFHESFGANARETAV